MRTETTVGTKIWLVVALCLGVGASGIGVLTYELKATSADYGRTLQSLQEQNRRQDAARVMQVMFKKEVQEWKDVLLRGYNPEDLAKYSKQFRAAAAKVDEAGFALEASVTDTEARKAMEEFVRAHTAMRAKYEAALQVFTQAKGENPREADQMVKGQDRAPTDLIDKAVAALVLRSNAKVASDENGVAREIWVVSLSVLAAFAGIGLAAGLTIRGISGTLRHAVRELNKTAGRVANAATQLSSSSQSLAQVSSEHAAALEEVSASTEQINSMARQNTEKSRAVSSLMTESLKKFVEANQRLEQMVVAMIEIGTESEKISGVIKVIDEIAFQTHILALNAAVQAAQAGEAGLGFAVVAHEVGNLARRSTQAANDTSALIQESVIKSNQGKTKVDQVSERIRVITDESAKVKVLVEEMNAGSQEQAKGTMQIGKAIRQMEQVTQQVAAGAEESAAGAQELHAHSESLRNLVVRLTAMVGAS